MQTYCHLFEHKPVLTFNVAKRRSGCRSNPIGIIEERGATVTKLEIVIKTASLKFRCRIQWRGESRISSTFIPTNEWIVFLPSGLSRAHRYRPTASKRQPFFFSSEVRPLNWTLVERKHYISFAMASAKSRKRAFPPLLLAEPMLQ